MYKSKKKSLYKKMIYINTTYILILFLLLSAVLGRSICTYMKNSWEKEISQIVDPYAENIESMAYMLISRTNVVLQSLDFLKGLDKEYDSYYELIKFLEFAEIFFYTGDDGAKLMVYTENPTLFSNGRFSELNNLFEKDEVLKKFDETSEKIIWSENVSEYDKNKVSISFYREIMIKHRCIIKGTIYINLDVADGKSIQLLSIQQKPENYGKNPFFVTVSRPIFQNYCIVASLNNQDEINKVIIMITIIIIIVGLIIVITMLVMSRYMKKITLSMGNLLSEIESQQNVYGKYECRSDGWIELEEIEMKMCLFLNEIQRVNGIALEREKECKKLEQKSLNYKVNPHLLYNSLSAINYLALKSGNKEICEAIEIMVDYYHKVLDCSDYIITIREDVEMIKSFIRINSVALGKNINFITNIPDDLYRSKIVHLLLQPVVENTIKHGLPPNREEITISMNIHEEENRLIIEISDDGIGITDDKLNDLQNKGKLGYGLTSVKERISFYYGDECGFEISGKRGVGAITTFRLKKL